MTDERESEATAETPERALLIEEKLCAVLLAGMVALMFLQAASRNVDAIAKTAFGNWLAHASEVLPSGLTWLTFLGCAAVTRRQELLRVNLIRLRVRPAYRRGLEVALWGVWLAFFGVLTVLGAVAVYTQRNQMTSLDWLPGWAVGLGVPVGSSLVAWRTIQNIVRREDVKT